MSITTNVQRVGNFTSSEIVALTKEGKKSGTWGAPALTYIEEKNFERRLGRAIDTESNARPLSWGKCVESFAFGHLGLEYSLCSTETIVHPEYDFWSGSPDGVSEDAVIDLKCPITLKSFCQLVQPLYEGLDGMEAMNMIRAEHKDGDKFYWQLVSNAALSGKRFAELIIFCPYQSEINEIKQHADGKPNYYWIWAADESELPFLPNGGYYKNINKIKFEVSDYDKELLINKVKEAGEMLIPRQKMLNAPDESTPFVMVASHDESVNATIVQ